MINRTGRSPAAIIGVTQREAKKRQKQKQRLAGEIKEKATTSALLKKILNFQGLTWERGQDTETLKTEIETQDALCANTVTYERKSKHQEVAARLHELVKKLQDYQDAPGWIELHQKNSKRSTGLARRRIPSRPRTSAC